MEFQCRIKEGGALDFGERNRVIFKQFLSKNKGLALKIIPIFPESKNQRGFLEGCLMPLITYYQEGLDHNNSDHVRQMREAMKMEFNAELVSLKGKQTRIAKTTQGRDNMQPFLEKVMTWLIENYAPPTDALDPEKYKNWRDTIFPTGGPDTYIDYLIAINVL